MPIPFAGFTRRDLLTTSLRASAAAALARLAGPLPALADSIAQDARVATTPLVDKGFALVRKVGDFAYATISDSTKGPQTLSNGGFIVGKDAALLIEGHMQAAGAAFELEALRLVTKAPVQAALNTHYHFDHSYGNAFYGAQGIPIWAHAKASALMVQNYSAMQGAPKAAVLGPIEKQMAAAKDEKIRKRLQTDLNAFTLVYGATQATVLALPNHPLDPGKLPMTLDLGGVRPVLETHPGHTPTDVIVRLPEVNVTFTGDLLFHGMYPVTLDADMAAWRKVMDHFAGYGKDALFIPGHGQVCGQEGIAAQIAVMDELGAHAEKMFKAGASAAEASDRYDVPANFSQLGIFSWGLTVGRAMESYYASYRKAKAPAKKAS